MIASLDTLALQDLFAAGEHLILPQSHAARLLRSRLELPPGHALQTTPPLAWQEWTASLWADLLLEGLEDRLLLNRLQEEHLWQEILRSAADSDSVAELSSSAISDLATLARSALQAAAAYRVVPRVRAEADTTDARTFSHWLELFGQRSRRDRLLAPAFLEEALGKHVRAGAIQLPAAIHLLGFEKITPAQRHLLDALATAGVAVHQSGVHASEAPSGLRQALTLGDREEELRFAVRLVAQKAREVKETTPRFALICPDPGEHRHDLERLFRELLAPELEPVGSDLSSAPWNFATSAPLNTVPLIGDALDLLRWAVAPLPLDRIGQLLRSPFFTYSDPPELRAQFDMHSPQRVPALRGTLDLSGFASVLARSDSGAGSFPEIRAFEKTGQTLLRERGRRSAADWTEGVRKLLGSVGWPGPRSLSAAEFRATEAWEGLLDLLATLQFNDATLSFAELLDRLVLEAGHLPAPAPRLDVPVQVLTPSEAEALTFDLAIYLDATDRNLPRIERRHPLLPQGLQRSLGIGDPAKAWEDAQNALESLCRRSKTLVLLASRDDAAGEAELTPLAAALGFVAVNNDVLLPEDAIPSVVTEPIEDSRSLPLTATDTVPGGVDVLQLQAACGFRAFATHRLAAKDVPPRTMGIDSREGGSLLHDALEMLWRELKTQAALKVLLANERREFARRAVKSAIAKRRLKAPAEDRWSEHYLRVLERRYTTILVRWLDVEAERAPFTITALEQKQNLALGPIRLDVRIDRVDEVAGGQVLVDYKSSYDLSNKHWLDSRPDAPQLPAYALGADPDTLSGIAFAQVRPGEKMGWISLTHAPGLFPRKRNKTVDFPTQLDTWRTELTRLAEAFADGDAGVDPKSYPHTCQYCAHRLLCRLDPTTLLEQEEEDDATPEEDLFG